MVLRKKKKQLSLCSECGKSNTPAIDASRYGHEDCLVTAYHELGVFNERDNFGATPVHYAARFGQLACLKWLVTNSGISANALAQVRKQEYRFSVVGGRAGRHRKGGSESLRGDDPPLFEPMSALDL